MATVRSEPPALLLTIKTLSELSASLLSSNTSDSLVATPLRFVSLDLSLISSIEFIDMDFESDAIGFKCDAISLVLKNNKKYYSYIYLTSEIKNNTFFVIEISDPVKSLISFLNFVRVLKSTGKKSGYSSMHIMQLPSIRFSIKYNSK